MLEAGLDLDGELLALACASHSGEPFHLDGVRRVLAAAGLDESALQTPPDYPVDEVEKLAFVAAGRPPAPLAMNCSGKHAAMLATCVANGWPTDTYPDAGPPAAAGAARRPSSGWPASRSTATGVDGCGAPLFALTLAGLARAFVAHRHGPAGHAGAPGGRGDPHASRVARRHPPRRDGRSIAGVPGLVAKDGAEGVYAAALPDGRAVDAQGRRRRPASPPAGHGRRAAAPRRGRPGASPSWPRCRCSAAAGRSARSARRSDPEPGVADVGAPT